MRSRRPFVFLDKDGTLVRDVPYNVDPARVSLAEGVESLSRLSDAGFGLAIVSNQSGVARGLCTEAEVVELGRFLIGALGDRGVRVDGFYYCPHHPAGSVAGYAMDCSCRKPAPGLLLSASADFRADLASSWFVGDILDDIEAGHRAGCRAVMVDVGNETRWEQSELRRPEAVVSSVPEAVERILSETGAAIGDGASAHRRSDVAADLRPPAETRR